MRNPNSRLAVALVALAAAACSKAPATPAAPSQPRILERSLVSPKRASGFHAQAEVDGSFSLVAAPSGAHALATVRLEDLSSTSPWTQRRWGWERAFALGTERVERRAGGLEQSWRIESMPSHEGALGFEVALRGAGEPSTTRTGLHFPPANGRPGWRCSHATWIDARGARVAIPAEWVQGRVRFSVPAEVWTHAAYPAVLDPTISAEQDVDAPLLETADEWDGLGGVATDGTDFLATWATQTYPELTFRAARVSAAGQVLDPLAIILPVPDGGAAGPGPSPAWDGAEYVISWSDGTSLVTERLASTGEVLDAAPVKIATPASPAIAQSLACVSAECLLVWTQGPSTYQDVGTLYGVRFVPGGALIDSTPLVFSGGKPSMSPSVTSDGTRFLVSWIDYNGFSTTNVVTVPAQGQSSLQGSPLDIRSGPYDNWPTAAGSGSNFLTCWDAYDYYTAGPANAVLCALIDGAGVVQPGSPFPISTAAQSGLAPAVAFDGVDYVVRWNDGNSSVRMARVTVGGLIRDPGGVLVGGVNLSNDQFGFAACAGTRCLTTYQTMETLPQSYQQYVEAIVGARFDATAGSALDAAPFPISTGERYQAEPSIAFNGQNFLVTWSDGLFAQQLMGARFLPNGTPLDPNGFAISGPDAGAGRSSIGVSGDEYLVAWDTPTGLSAARVTSAGAVLDPNGIALPTTSTFVAPSIAGSSSEFAVVWAEGNDLKLVRLDLDGGLLDATPLELQPSFQSSAPAIGSDGTGFLVAYNQQRNNNEGVYFCHVAPDGTVTDPFGEIIASTNYSNEPANRVIWDGSEYVVSWRGGAFIRVLPDGGAAPPGQVSIPDFSTEPAASGLVYDGQHLVALGSPMYQGGLSMTVYDDDGGAGPTIPLDPTFYPFSATVAASNTGTILIAYQAIVSDAGPVTTRVRLRVITGAPGPQGAPCMQASDCASGFCTDGVCCDTACGNSATNDCQACSVSTGAPTNGTCAVLPSSYLCGIAYVTCDVPEYCDGVSPACPPNQVAAAGKVCRTSQGCAPEAVCDGTTTICPPVAVFDAGTVCRPLQGPCDVAEVCDGRSSQCPYDRIATNGTACNDGGGFCNAGACTPDGGYPCTQQPPFPTCVAGYTYSLAQQACLPQSAGGSACTDPSRCIANGYCDYNGSCNTWNGGPACTTGDQCNAPVCEDDGGCGASPFADGTVCDGGNLCALAAACQGGSCVTTGTLTCPPPDVCHAAGTCQPSTGACFYPPAPHGTACPGGMCQAGACVAGASDGGAVDGGDVVDAGEFDAGGFDAGSLDAGADDAGALDAGEFDAGSVDGGALDADAGQSKADAGSPIADGGSSSGGGHSGCGCRAASGSDAGWLALSLLVLAGARRRRG